MKVLVTGATGFIGQHLARTLVTGGHEVRCLVREKSNVKELGDLAVGLEYGDVTDEGSLDRATRGVELVYHLAAIRGERNLALSAYRRVNVEGTRNMLEASSKRGVKRFVFVSSIGVMGWIRHPPGDEKSSCKPQGKYHTTKLEAENLAMSYHRNHRLAVTTVRPVMTYGRDVDCFLYNLSRLIRDRRFRMIGNGNNHLHIIDVRNLVAALLAAPMPSDTEGGIYIVADPQPITLRKLTNLIAMHLGVATPRVYIPVPLANLVALAIQPVYRTLPGHTIPMITRDRIDLLSRNRFYDISKAKRDFAFQPAIPTEDGVIDALEWYRASGNL